VRVEYGDNGRVLEQVFFLDKAEDHRLFTDLVQSQRIQTIHTQEATLEQIFMRLTGRGLA
jgi:fluoroquinolone transport system ATP-binding protein